MISSVPSAVIGVALISCPSRRNTSPALGTPSITKYGITIAANRRAAAASSVQARRPDPAGSEAAYSIAAAK